MKKYIVLALILAVFTASQVCAETLNLTALPTQQAGGYYVGAVPGNINGGTSANYYCDDFLTHTSVPNSFTVLVSSLSNISGTKFYNVSDPAGSLKKYEQVGWLMYEMNITPPNTPAIAAIQFAMWDVFTPTAPIYGTQNGTTFADSAYWLDASAKINPNSYDFSQMRIYTAQPASSNQEFIGGKVSAVPEPSTWLLICLGFVVLMVCRKRQQDVQEAQLLCRW